jgi:hydroxymethylpyrimidine/phosphomethylpyrimidine kinase
VIIVKKVLTIAGSDSGGGAGIQADLKTFAARGVYGMSAITALTAQNTRGVHGVVEIDAEFVGQQIDSVMSDIGADVWKTGMLSNSEIIKVVADRTVCYGMKFLILDPVMIAKGGDPLLRKEACESLIELLVPLAYIITPNHYEAQVLTGMEIRTQEDSQVAAIEIYKMGAKNVVVKGGSLPNTENSVDILYDGQKSTNYITPRINTPNTHGTGCTFASAIAAEIAKGYNVVEAVHIAKAYLTTALRAGADLSIGKGHGPVKHSLDCEVDIDLNLIKVQ